MSTKDGRPLPTIKLPAGFDASFKTSSHKNTGWQIELTHPNGEQETIAVGAEAPNTVIEVELQR